MPSITTSFTDMHTDALPGSNADREFWLGCKFYPSLHGVTMQQDTRNKTKTTLLSLLMSFFFLNLEEEKAFPWKKTNKLCKTCLFPHALTRSECSAGVYVCIYGSGKQERELSQRKLTSLLLVLLCSGSVLLH